MIGSENSAIPGSTCPSAQQLLIFIDEKVAAVQRTINDDTVLSSLESITAIFVDFAMCSITDIQKTIVEASSKLCSLDSLPTNVLKDVLPEIMPLVANICNELLQNGHLPVSQRHAIVMP